MTGATVSGGCRSRASNSRMAVFLCQGNAEAIMAAVSGAGAEKPPPPFPLGLLFQPLTCRMCLFFSFPELQERSRERDGVR